MLVSNDAFYQTKQNTVVALGTFDGVHAGHRAVIERAVSLAKENGQSSCVWCFSDSFKKAPTILSAQEKQKIMEELGVEIYIATPCKESVCSLSPEQFFQTVLLKGLQAKTIVCGFNFSFGKDGKGTPETLENLCKEYGISLVVIPAVLFENEPVSSTRIRELLASGQQEKVKKMM